MRPGGVRIIPARARVEYIVGGLSCLMMRAVRVPMCMIDVLHDSMRTIAMMMMVSVTRSVFETVMSCPLQIDKTMTPFFFIRAKQPKLSKLSKLSNQVE